MVVPTRHEDLAKAFGDFAVELQTSSGSDNTLQTIVQAAAHIVPGARWAGISLVQGKQVVPKAPTDPRVAALDELQSQFNDGPCLTSLRDHHTVQIDDMRSDPRWPVFAGAAYQHGVLSLLSFRLFVEESTLGALNIYSDRPHAFSDESIFVGEILAQHAAIAMVGSTVETQFKDALATRDIIGQAKGILMHSMDLTGLQAFSLLTRLSQDSNRKLVEIARLVVEQHETQVAPAKPSPAQML